MSTSNYIVDTPLPLSQDFKLLKKEGLAYIQQYSGNEWTNLNAVDPGVTILDQVCFALTELGYCNDFSITDILTDPDGKLQVKDQFYLPETILSTSPLTITDYRKYLIDGIDAVKNAIICKEQNPDGTFNGKYGVYLLIDQSINADEIGDIRKASFFYLNKRRNIGEFFSVPKCLQPLNFNISGRIDIEKATDLNKILLEVDTRIRNYIFPEVIAIGYDQMNQSGTLINDIFNGPLLQNGFIETAALSEKKNQIGLTEVINVIGSVTGITSVSVSGFYNKINPLSVSQLNSTLSQIINIDLIGSIGSLEIYCKGVKIPNTAIANLNLTPRTLNVSIVYGASASVEIKLPKGKFRDINSYYSIQNTFPEIFAVGQDATNSNASDFEIAQSRQLKGYLTLFDQVLANQFSQLANIGSLFSFKNSLTGTPSDEEAFYAMMDESGKRNLEYPVPYLNFSPTYFYQSLYDVPHIKPLLKDNDSFNFNTGIISAKEEEQKSWLAYKEDPYNPYMSGLMQFMEDESNNLQRRDDILDHLLARHGESPLVINSLINGSTYSNDTLKDRVIFKSLYLQNLGLLSYFRQKAYNCPGANKINRISISPEVYESIMTKADPVDFIFNSKKVDQLEKLTEQDFINYSAIELKLSLLLGLKTQYRDFITDAVAAKNFSEAGDIIDDELRMCIWMIRHRRGLIFMETGFLYNLADPDNYPVLNNEVELIFPGFMPQLYSSEFNDRLTLFLQDSLPAQVTYSIRFVDTELLEKLILAFVQWHNGLIYRDKNQPWGKPLNVCAKELVAVLNEITKSEK